MNESIDRQIDDTITREELHHRQIDLRFYKRSDGLFEVVAQMMDTKSNPFRLQLRDEPVPPHTPIHHMIMTMVVDEFLLVKDIKAEMKATPFGVCLGAQDTLSGIVGLTIGPGWTKKTKELLGGSASCTHLMELLGPMATTAFQGIAPQRMQAVDRPENEHMRVGKVNSCYAYAEHREVIANLWPDLYKPKAQSSSKPTPDWTATTKKQQSD